MTTILKTGRIICNIAQLRRRKNWSQDDLIAAVARRLPDYAIPLSRTLLSSAESGKCILIPIHVEAICHVLGVQEEALYPYGVKNSA